MEVDSAEGPVEAGLVAKTADRPQMQVVVLAVAHRVHGTHWAR